MYSAVNYGGWNIENFSLELQRTVCTVFIQILIRVISMIVTEEKNVMNNIDVEDKI